MIGASLIQHETIKRIREVQDITQTTFGAGGGVLNLIGALTGYAKYDGFAIETDLQTIYVLIDNGQCCCEDFGYLVSEDDLTAYEGAALLDIAVVDEALTTRIVEETPSLDGGAIVFVNFHTNRGVFQIACYNAHNGYYGHEVHLISQQVTQIFGV